MIDFLGVKVAVGVERVEQESAQQAFGDACARGLCQPLKVAQDLSLAGQLHELQDQLQMALVFIMRGVVTREVEQGVMEFW